MVIDTAFVQTSLRDVLHVVFRRKWLIAFVFVAVFSGVAAFTYMVSELYRSEAKLLIRLGRETVQMDPTVSGPVMPVQQDRESEVNSELAILTSEELTAAVVQSVGANRLLMRTDESGGQGVTQDVRLFRHLVRQTLRWGRAATERILVALDITTPLTTEEQAFKRLRKRLGVEAPKRSNVITVAYEAPAPELAQEVLDKLVRLYLERHIQAYASQATPAFFEDQERKLKQTLTDRETVLETFRAEHGIATLEGQRAALVEEVSGLEKQQQEAGAMVEATQARVQVLEQALQSRAKTQELSRVTGRTNAVADALKQRLEEMRLEETNLSARYEDDHRPLVELRERIRQAEAALGREVETRTEVTTGLDTSFQTLELTVATERGQLQAQRARQTAIEGDLKQVRDRLTALAGEETELTQLTREVSIAESEYRQYRDNLQRSRISAALDLDKVSNVSVVQAATRPMAPVRPRKAFNLGLGAVLGLCGGLFLAFAVEYLDDTLTTAEKTEKRLGVTVLTTLSEKEFKTCL